MNVNTKRDCLEVPPVLEAVEIQRGPFAAQSNCLKSLTPCYKKECTLNFPCPPKFITHHHWQLIK